LFDGLLVDWKTDPADLRLKSGEMPFHLFPFCSPENSQKYIPKKVLKHHVALGYQYPSYIIPKENGTVCVISDFRVLNLKHHRNINEFRIQS
jgi:hypothetical protein